MQQQHSAEFLIYHIEFNYHVRSLGGRGIIRPMVAFFRVKMKIFGVIWLLKKPVNGSFQGGVWKVEKATILVACINGQ